MAEARDQSLIAMMAFSHLGSAVLSQGEACRRCQAGCVPIEMDCRHERCPDGPATEDCRNHCANYPAVTDCLSNCTICEETSDPQHDPCTRCLYPCASIEMRCQFRCRNSGANGSVCRAQCADDPNVVSCNHACSSICEETSEPQHDSCTRCLYPCASIEMRCQFRCRNSGANGSVCRAQCADDPDVVSCNHACSSICEA